ncbi:immunoglobulin superfamily member 10 [Rhinolophus sinicus]|uniref:immunoglobulin superfamily member 10 n=1 Tax=Rhinolophus sinicus TaxID=89399 RepID=UPI003D7A32D3
MKANGGGITCFLASFAVICLVAPRGGGACPRRCACYLPTEVHCTFRYLTAIPDSIPPSVERINLGYNSLVRLTETDFSGLNKLELLLLHSNGVHTIPAKTFSDLQALQVLKMSYNKVRKLEKDTFYGLKSLTRLHMDHNNIEFINPEVFYGLTFLRLVHLEGNRLTKLHPDTFVSLRYLQIFKTSFIKYLYLSDNFLSTLPQEMVSCMPDLESLYLHGNPWTCDCHLKWLSDWIQEKPDIIKCKKDRSPSSPQQCPLCTNPRTSDGKPLATVQAAAFLCAKPTIDPSLKLKHLTILEDSGSVSISPQDFMEPFGSLTLNMTDQSGNEANMVCSIHKPSSTPSIAFTPENDYIVLNTSFSTFLVCNIGDNHIQPVWQILALYSDSPLVLERSHLLTETPQLCYKYKQVAPKPEDIFTSIEADLRADPSWLMQPQISLQLNRTATTLSTLQIQYSSDAQVTLPRAEMRPVKHKWTMISRDNNTKLERTVLVGGTIDLDCPGQGDPTPHLEWLLADGSKVRAPYVSEDGRILIDKSGKLELQMADSFDTGTYHCISTNYDDADILTYRITVVESSIESYHANGAHHTIFMGETLNLPCHSTGVPDASVSWVLPGNTVLYQSSGEKQILNNGTLRILQVTPKDQGLYRCVAANPSGVDFLINQVSIKIKGPRPEEHNVETDGSGLDEFEPSINRKDPPVAQLPLSAPAGGEAGEQALSPSKKHSYREFTFRRRGDSTHRRFREHRRPFPPSARRIDPQRWAALLEKAKKNMMPEKRENTTAKPPLLVTQLLKIPGEEGDSSGMLPPDEEFIVLATNVPHIYCSYLHIKIAFLSRLLVEQVVFYLNFDDLWLYIFLPSGLALSERKQDSRFRVLPNGTLSIQGVAVQDRGQYLCSASNPFGTDRLHVTLSVVSYPPRILDRRTKEITVHSGSTVELKCKAEGRPSPTISWILANQTVVSESSKGNTQALVTPDGTLVIHNVSVYDRGFYKCTAWNSDGQDSLLVKIQVIAAPPVILEQKRQVIAGIWGESLQLPCTAKGTPQPSVHWVLSDGTEVKPLQFIDSKLFLFSNGTLYIRNIASSDRGTYECIATSSTGSERRVVIITMEERETIPRIEFASQTWNEVNFGDKLLLNCSAIGEPKPQIIWRLPSKAVVGQWHRMGSRIHVYPNGSLFIGSITEKDGGDYLCVARNKMGDDLILMHVSLRLKPAKIDHKQHFKKQVFHGKDFQVDCKASGSPVPQISWSLPDGTMINNAMQADDSGHRTRRYTLFNNGTLYFNKVGLAEEGDYTCYAQNTLGKDEMKVHLTVVTAAPRIRKGNKANTRVQAGDTAILDCEVTGEPKPKIFWLLPSNDMISFSKDRHTFHANGSLSIHRVKLLDSGEYVCVARNPSGDDTKMYKMDVVAKPPLINGLYTNKTVIKATAVRHSKKHFDCRAEGTPSPQIMWIMPDNIFLTAPYYGSRITVHKNGTLEIRNVRLSDSADFICVARNEGGESVLVVQLEVLEMLRRPTFRNPFNEKIVAQLGKSTALNCSVDGNPPPEIIWILPNGTRFSNGPQNPQHLIASNGSFIIYKTTRDDAGKYRCAARNKVGYIEKLIVLEIGQKPVILTYASGTVYCISGESLSLHCVSDGSPKPNIKWTVPSGHIIDRPQITGKYILYENGTLVIKEATAYDRGSYICKAQNSVGHALITVPVMVVAYPPRIINRPPRSVLTRTGTAIQLHCVALGVPKPEITWDMPDQPLLSLTNKESTHGIEPFHPQGTLVIPNPQTTDSGIYKCTAKNLLGSDSATTYIQVI